MTHGQRGEGAQTSATKWEVETRKKHTMQASRSFQELPQPRTAVEYVADPGCALHSFSAPHGLRWSARGGYLGHLGMGPNSTRIWTAGFSPFHLLGSQNGYPFSGHFKGNQKEADHFEDRFGKSHK